MKCPKCGNREEFTMIVHELTSISSTGVVLYDDGDCKFEQHDEKTNEIEEVYMFKKSSAKCVLCGFSDGVVLFDDGHMPYDIRE